MTIAEKLTKIADNEQKVYDAGYERGYHDGEIVGGGSYDQGFEDGKDKEHEAFWDVYMPDNIVNSQYIFYSPRWTDENFYPNKDIKLKGGATFAFSSHRITNLKQRLIDCGVTLDTSGVTSGNYMFCFCSVLTHLPTISLLGLTEQVNNMFEDNKAMIEVEKIILKDDGSTTFVRWFNNCNALTTIAFEGVIGQNINFQWSTLLTRPSIESIVNHLSDTASGKTLTLSKLAADNAFPCPMEDGNGGWINVGCGGNGEWLELVATKSNWQISLV